MEAVLAILVVFLLYQLLDHLKATNVTDATEKRQRHEQDLQSRETERKREQAQTAKLDYREREVARWARISQDKEWVQRELLAPGPDDDLQDEASKRIHSDQALAWFLRKPPDERQALRYDFQAYARRHEVDKWAEARTRLPQRIHERAASRWLKSKKCPPTTTAEQVLRFLLRAYEELQERELRDMLVPQGLANRLLRHDLEDALDYDLTWAELDYRAPIEMFASPEMEGLLLSVLHSKLYERIQGDPWTDPLAEPGASP